MITDYEITKDNDDTNIDIHIQLKYSEMCNIKSIMDTDTLADMVLNLFYDNLFDKIVQQCNEMNQHTDLEDVWDDEWEELLNE